MPIPSRSTLKILTFLGLTFALTFGMPWQSLAIIGGLMWAPGIAAVVVQHIFERRITSLGWRLPALRWWGLAFAFPLAYVSLAYCVAWSTGAAELRPDALAWIREVIEGMLGVQGLPEYALIPLFVGILATLGMLHNTIAALGEEIGWRGMLYPELEKRMGSHRAALVSGLIWAVWHWQGILFGGYNAGADPAYSLAMFTLMIVLMSVGMGWLTTRTRSLWPAVLVHAGHNLLIQGAYEPLTTRPESGQWVTGEWGAAIPLALVVVLLVASMFAGRRPRLPSIPAAVG